MIQKLELENFQGYKKASVSFAPGINVITGDNDQGKSSIIRALNYLGRNRPTRNNFINDSEPNQTLKITGTFNNGIVSRIKGKSKNQYIINKEQPLKALKTEVPTEVEEITQLKDVNFQEQDNPYFLLSLTPGAVAKEINKVANLEVMDKLIKEMKGGVTTSKQNHSFWIEKYKEANAQRKDLKWTKNARVSIDAIKKIDIEIEKDSELYNKAVDLVNTVIDDEEKIKAFNGVEKAISGLLKISSFDNELSGLKKLHGKLQETFSQVESLEALDEKYNDLTLAGTHLMVVKILDDTVSKLKYKQSKLQQYKDLHWKKMGKNIEVSLAEKQFKQALKKAGICPLCGTKF